MRYAVLLAGFGAVIAGTGAVPHGVRADPVVVAQADGGGVGGSLAAPATRTVRAKPRPRPAAAARSAPTPAPRVIVRREVVYQPRYIERPAAPEPRRSARASGGLASYDGMWTVSSNGCSAAGTTQVMISRGRISASNGSGRVSPSGAVSIVSAVNGLTIAGQGQITGGSASGSFRQSDGCAGSWSAVKL
ncbi:hypothetical protein [Lichenibacterium dinghuense]|uniref:hypothetical protein n=1 Tax=Lichenibacterium dinghuense TaxID=2895977 RepID=UPI001F39E9FF|nr:hypothetical protein [Lichenibacterium sp. 6Y81]